MKLIFDRPKGKRFKRYGIGYSVEGHCYEYDTKKWVHVSERLSGWATSTMPCKTIRAFKRMIKKHPNIKGKAEWVNKYMGYCCQG